MRWIWMNCGFEIYTNPSTKKQHTSQKLTKVIVSQDLRTMLATLCLLHKM